MRIRTIFQRGEAPEILDVEANLDPLEILKAAGVGILVGGIALTAGWLLWDGLAAPTPIGPVQVFRGMKEAPFWRKQRDRFVEEIEERQVCKDLKDQFDNADPQFRESFRVQAQSLGCKWAQ